MRNSFALKLGALVTLLTMTVASVALYVFYTFSREAIIDEMKGRLKDLTHIGSYLFQEDERSTIVALSDLARRNTVPRTQEFLASIHDGESRESIPKQKADEYMQSLEFQNIVQVLRKIQQGSSENVIPLRNLDADFNAPIYWAYLMTSLPESKDNRVTMVLANSNYEKIDHNGDGRFDSNEGGQPIGSLYAGSYDLFGKPYDTGEIAISPDWYSDWGGTFMTAVVPIKNAHGEVIATLGLDYLVTTQSERLKKILYVCYAVFAASLAMSIVFSFMLAYVINRPITRLSRGAERISKRDFRTQIDVRSHDEFGLLADTLNGMAVEIHNYQSGLEKIVEERTQALGKANDEILKLYDTLRKENESLGAELDIARSVQMRLLPQLSELSRLQLLDVAFMSVPAPQVGGDYFDVMINDNGSMILGIGDVSGHGLETGLFMMMMHTAVRTLIDRELSNPIEVYERINEVAYVQSKKSSVNPFMTLSLVAYDGKSSFVITGQHEDIIVVREKGRAEILDTVSLGLPLGIIPSIAAHVQSLTVRLSPGQTLILNTNGVTDVKNDKGQRFSCERLAKVVAECYGESAETTRKAVVKALAEFKSAKSTTEDTVFDDDVTLVILKQKE